jgi:type II restriction/modification system DNA methylase subunit YeeA
MPVNTAALKTFAPAMRRQLLEAVGRKLDLLLHSQTPDTLSTYAKQIAELREQEAENREQLLERVAYTWFNRLCALRYLDAKGWHPFGCKVLMPAAEGETQPELLKLMRAGSLPAELKAHTNEGRLHGLLDGQIPPAIAGADPQGEVYRELVLASCRSYHQLLPELFEGLDDASELLIPDDLLSEGSIAGAFRNAISDEDCEDVEIIGWLYQFYISEKKDQVIGKVVKSEDIPAATQLFTPNWIVKYMVQNSLGAAWLATYPDSPLKGQMEFYIEPAEQTSEVQAQLAEITPESLDPEELTLIDPACGSGHILVEAYDLLKAIYLERGYRQRDIPELILTKNLYGLDICPRAAQLAAFSLFMKGREDDRRFLERGTKLNVMALVSSDELDVEALTNAIILADYGLKQADLVDLKQLFEHATTFGSLIQVPDRLAEKLPALRRLSDPKGRDIFVAKAQKTLELLVRQAGLLATQYDEVVANPPYMGSKSFCKSLKDFVADAFSEGKADLYAAFALRNIQLAKEKGRIGMITIPNWMFLSSFEKLRNIILEIAPITTLVDNGRGLWGSDFGSCAFVLYQSSPSRQIGRFLRLFDKQGSVTSSKELERRFFSSPRFSCSNDSFMEIPGSPLAYWLGDAVRRLFLSQPRLGEMCDARVGLMTSDNDLFLRRWWEVSSSETMLCAINSEAAQKSNKRWFPHNKGGDFRKWWGNQEYLVDWQDNGRRIKDLVIEKYPYLNGDPNFVVHDDGYYFRPCVSWSEVTIGANAFRAYPIGFTFNVKGMSAFCGDSLTQEQLLSLCNSKLITHLCRALNPSVSFGIKNFNSLPGAVPREELIKEPIATLIRTAALDWDAYERSWDFQSLHLLSVATDPSPSLETTYTAWIANNKQTIAEMKRLEEENNRLFIDTYGLQDELSPEVPIEQITLTVNPAYRYSGNLSVDELWIRFRQDTMKELLSYATGCMIGRYSLDHPGLILANAADTLENYYTKVGKSTGDLTFQPDPDGIITVLYGEWFEDDIVSRTREFLAVTFPESSVGENLRFIEESLGKDIRKYFCSEFYKDHLQTYKKRPIYWMVQSPKKGFACLIYLHRYTKDTLNQVLNNYFRPYLQKLEARLAQLGLDQLNDDLPARERTAARKEAEKITKVLKECQAWEQDALLPLAQQRIELDLDDGVKVNYLKLQEVLAPIPGLAAKED